MTTVNMSTMAADHVLGTERKEYANLCCPYVWSCDKLTMAVKRLFERGHTDRSGDTYHLRI